MIVGLAVVLRLEHAVAEAAGGVDLLEDHQRQPRGRDRQPQPDEEPGQRAGEDDVADEPPPGHVEGLGQLDVAAVDVGQGRRAG